LECGSGRGEGTEGDPAPLEDLEVEDVRRLIVIDQNGQYLSTDARDDSEAVLTLAKIVRIQHPDAVDVSHAITFDGRVPWSPPSSTQVEVAFTRALVEDGKEYQLDEALLDELAHGVVPDNDERVPVLLAVSDNGPQMTSKATAVFMAGARIAQHFGRPGTPNDQAWVESFFGHLKGEFPHLDKITDPGDLEAELDRLREFYNDIRLHEGIGYVTPNDEHEGRGEAIRAARRAGLHNGP
jgi:hypothetical protein